MCDEAKSLQKVFKLLHFLHTWHFLNSILSTRNQSHHKTCTGECNSLSMQTFTPIVADQVLNISIFSRLNQYIFMVVAL